MATNERICEIGADFTTKAGHRAIVLKMTWCEKVKVIAPSLHDYAVGYVLLDEKPDIDVDDLDVHGGVTFTGCFGDNDLGLPVNAYAIGFDQAHWGDEHIVDHVAHAINECESLSQQLRNHAKET